jgi:hypothetical protein
MSADAKSALILPDGPDSVSFWPQAAMSEESSNKEIKYFITAAKLESWRAIGQHISGQAAQAKKTKPAAIFRVHFNVGCGRCALPDKADENNMQKQVTEWLIPIVLAVAAAVALWYYWLQVSQPQEEPLPPPPVAEPESLPGPLHPIPEMALQRGEPTDLVPLPSLDQSDEYFKLGLTDVFGQAIGALLVDAGMIEKIVATVDNLPRAHVAEKIRPVNKIEDQFRIESVGESDVLTISESNYDRYNALVNMLSAADLQAMADLYRRFYPLFQDAYQNLGYPDAYFNDRLVEVIDHLLATPEPRGPVEIVQPHVMYEYRDKSLEELSSGQKMMIRMGSEHAAKVKEVLRQARNLITDM